MIQNSKTAFLDAKNILLMARVLDRLERERSSNEYLDSVLSEVEHENGYKEKVPLVNQCVFLSMAYSTLLFLRESYFMQDPNAKKVLEEEVKPLFTKHSIDIQKGKNAKELGDSSPIEFIRRMRNALGHANVTIEEDFFRFEDANPSDNEDFVVITMPWHALGELTEMIFSAGNIITLSVNGMTRRSF
jgi:hypothetical protein